MNKFFKVGTKYQHVNHPECILTYTGGGLGSGTAIGGTYGEGIVINDPDQWRLYLPESPASFNRERMSKVLGDDVTTVGQKSHDEDSERREESKTPSASRVFEAGASRNSDEGKLDFEGFLSPTVLKAFAEYMHQNRFLESGEMRDSDNWQKGIPVDAYMKSMWRHFFDTWNRHRGIETPETQRQNLCGLLFNVMGMLHELIKEGNGE